jgi:hypothetical protein
MPVIAALLAFVLLCIGSDVRTSRDHASLSRVR